MTKEQQIIVNCYFDRTKVKEALKINPIEPLHNIVWLCFRHYEKDWFEKMLNNRKLNRLELFEYVDRLLDMQLEKQK